MILVGIKIEQGNCEGYNTENQFIYECADIHEASISVLKSTWSNSFRIQTFLAGEFHDTETSKTWTVDERGHTQRDYRNETINEFKERWGESILEAENDHEEKHESSIPYLKGVKLPSISETQDLRGFMREKIKFERIAHNISDLERISFCGKCQKEYCSEKCEIYHKASMKYASEHH
jgi:hypothetical protein